MTEFEKLQIDWLKAIAGKLNVIAGMIGMGVTLVVLKLFNIL